MMKVKNAIFLLFAFFSILQLAAQNNRAVTTVISKNKILIGEPAQLTIEADIPVSKKPGFTNIDSIPHFEFTGAPQIDTTRSAAGLHLKAVYQITSFDSGHWVIPSFQLAPGIKTDSIGVDVVFSDFDPNQDYHDIKDIIEVKNSRKKFPWWWYAAGAVLVGILLYYLVKRKKPVVHQTTETRIDPYDEAMNRLDQLSRNKPAIKTFYSELTDIFRIYIFKSRAILSLQKTTDDLVLQILSAGLTKQRFDELAQALRLSDFVKFAKYSPGSEDDNTVYNTIRDSITDLEKLRKHQITELENK